MSFHIEPAWTAWKFGLHWFWLVPRWRGIHRYRDCPGFYISLGPLLVTLAKDTRET